MGAVYKKCIINGYLHNHLSRPLPSECRLSPPYPPICTTNFLKSLKTPKNVLSFKFIFVLLLVCCSVTLLSYYCFNCLIIFIFIFFAQFMFISLHYIVMAHVYTKFFFNMQVIFLFFYSKKCILLLYFCSVINL